MKDIFSTDSLQSGRPSSPLGSPGGVSLTLFELNSLVRDVLETTFDQDYWVEAELSEVREVRGHCYMELVQKDLFGNTPVARASAKCWQRTWMQLRPRFERVTGQTLHAGLKVLLREALTDRIADREMFMKGIDYSYYYESDETSMEPDGVNNDSNR